MSLSRILQNPELQASIKSEHEAKSAKIAEHFSDRISHILPREERYYLA